MVESRNDKFRAAGLAGRMVEVGLAGLTGAPGRGVEDELGLWPGKGMLVNKVTPRFDPGPGFRRKKTTSYHFRRLAETEAILNNRAVVRFENCSSEQVEWNRNSSVMLRRVRRC
jgi:hypothetical protein